VARVGQEIAVYILALELLPHAVLGIRRLGALLIDDPVELLPAEEMKKTARYMAAVLGAIELIPEIEEGEEE